MKKAIWIIAIVIGALVITAFLGVYAYRTVRAASLPERFAQRFVGQGFGGGMGGNYTDEDLATALGISVDKLQTAYKTAQDETLKQAVSKGLITQAQADQLAQRGANLKGLGRFGNFGMLANQGIDYNANLATALGITVDKLKAAYLTAFNASIDRAVKDGSITQQQADLAKGRYALFSSDKFRSGIKTAFEDAVKQAVTDGTITQAQADQLLQNGAGNRMGGPGMGGPGMGFKGFGGWFGGMRGMRGFGGHGWDK